MTRIVVRQTDRVPDCSLCRDAVDAAAITCPGCRASYHGSCLDELASRCATLGCTALAVVAAPHQTSAFAVFGILAFVLLGTVTILAAVIGVSVPKVLGQAALAVVGSLLLSGLAVFFAAALSSLASAMTPPPRRSRVT